MLSEVIRRDLEWCKVKKELADDRRRYWQSFIKTRLTSACVENTLYRIS